MKQERITELWPTSYYKKIESATEKKSTHPKTPAVPEKESPVT